ncbi:putative Arsenite permease [groundwater metagenome]|uniref:Putative Arsenite permease n=1 Tax=groundwater metagenome TaxID=717931 RepID=A0A098EC70_9ZZZZ
MSILPIPIIVLFAVFILVSIRQIGNLRLQIWQLMLFGALVVLITGQISPNDALTSINFDVILFLFGVFVIGKALERKRNFRLFFI